jgi:hypothetical protein
MVGRMKRKVHVCSVLHKGTESKSYDQSFESVPAQRYAETRSSAQVLKLQLETWSVPTPELHAELRRSFAWSECPY